jgi:predicted Zn-dependent protease
MNGIIILALMASCHAAPQGDDGNSLQSSRGDDCSTMNGDCLPLCSVCKTLPDCYSCKQDPISIKPKLPSFKIAGYSRSNVPELSVTFANGQTQEMILEPYYESRCNFIGSIKSEPGSSVGVTGCLDKQGDEMHITLLSALNIGSTSYTVDYNGHVSAIESPFKYQKGPTHRYLVTSRTGENCGATFVEEGNSTDKEEIDIFQEMRATEAAYATTTSVKSKLFAYLQFGYDSTLSGKLGYGKFNAWVIEVMTHVQTHYRHASLGTNIEFQFDVNESVRKYENLPAVEDGSTGYDPYALCKWSRYALESIENKPKVDLFVSFGYDPPRYGMSSVGVAWVGTACKKSPRSGNCGGQDIWGGTSFNEYQSTPAATAETVAHEMGHNFGMSHDFDAKNGGQYGACNNFKGIMSYANTKVMQWSSCSKSNFLGYYASEKWGDTCLSSFEAYEAPCVDSYDNGRCVDEKNGYTYSGVSPICVNPSRYGGCTGYLKDVMAACCQATCKICS